MSISWHIDEDARLVTVSVRGVLTLEDALQTLTELYAQPSYRPPLDDLWDLREAKIEARPGDVVAFVRFIRSNRGDRGTDRTALVVSNAFTYGISRMYQTHVETWLSFSVRVFRDLDEALAWLEHARSQE